MFAKLTLLFFRLFFISVLIGQLGRLPIPGVEGGVYLADVVLGGLFLSWLAWRLVEIKRYKILDTEVIIALFLGFTLLSFLFALSWLNGTQVMVAAIYWVRLAVYMGLFKIAYDLYKDLEYQPNLLLEFVIASFAFLGLLQYAIFPDFSQYVQHGWDPHYYRVLSTFFDPNYAGAFLSLGFIFLLHRLYLVFLENKLKRGSRTRLIFELIIVGLAMMLTFSRSTYLAFILGLMVFSWFKDKRILIIMALVAAIAFAGIPRVRERVVGAVNIDETAQLRLANYQDTLDIIQDNPIMGVGFNAYRYVQDEYGYFRDSRGVNYSGGHAGAGADNSFLFIWATGGVLSLITLLSLFVYWSVRSLKSLNRPLLFGTLIVIGVHAQFVNSLFYTPILAWLLVITGFYLYDHN